METQINNIEFSTEVHAALTKYNKAVDSALEAVQKLESISITAHLAELFWVKEQQTAKMIQQDYLIGA